MRPLLFLLPAALWSCSALDPLAADGRCGNHIVEPLADEDCDGRATPPGLRCGQVGEPGACRYRCDDTADCPTGWGCGLDGLCRAGDGRLAVRAALGFAGDSLVGDVDADGRPDLLSFGPGALTVAFGDESGRFASTRSLNSALTDAPPTVVRLDDDASDDLVLPSLGGAQFMLGGDRRGLTALPVTTASLGGARDVRVLGLRAAAPFNTDELLVAGVGADGRIQAWLEGREVEAALTDLPADASLLRAQGRVRQEGEPDRWAVAVDDARFVWLVEGRCRGMAPCSLAVVDAVRLPDDHRLSDPGVFVTDADGDGDDDLWASVAGAGGPRLAVATQTDGRFAPFELLDGATPALTCEGCMGGAPSQLAAIADLDGDGVGDVITTRGAWIYKPGQPGSVRQIISPVRPWNRAIVADFNADGRMDLAANRPGSLDIFVNSGRGFFNERALAVDEIDALTAGDFDGDLAPDLAYVTGGTSVVVLFSGSQRLPTEPELMGRLPTALDETLRIQTLETVRLTSLSEATGADFLDDLVFVLGRPESDAPGATVAADRLGVLQGNSARRMASGVPRRGRVYSGVVGGDLGEGPEVWVGEVVRGGSAVAPIQFSRVDAAEVLAGVEAVATPLRYEDGCETPRGFTKHMLWAHLGADATPFALVLDGATPERTDQTEWGLWILSREGQTLRCMTPAPVTAPQRAPGTPVLADLDGDGLPDLAALMLNRTANLAGSEAVAPDLVVWWGQAGPQPLADPERIELDLPAVQDAALAALRVGSQAAARLLVTAADGVDTLAFGADRRPTVLAREAGGLTVDQPRQLVPMDANGDGLADLLLVEETETLVALQGACGARDAALGQCTRSAP